MSGWLPFDAKIIWLTSQIEPGSSLYSSIFPLNPANKLSPSCVMILRLSTLEGKKIFQSEIGYENADLIQESEQNY